eukprot:CAMPEP_0115110128 /NCGR_PEP_ID=MMETSP0227-20121206/39184_1 /TAXON_ID=89957 /ORGANISM="Polarella glacialis, Strain CCMP 1383" /LENGTH=140 /DNA_ID=CAMNT_0002509093 /DNA_START=102 /DNA_END=524 /DNA_ORIENTATION=-
MARMVFLVAASIATALLVPSAALPGTSLLQVTVQLQRGSVSEIAPGTLGATGAANALSSRSSKAANSSLCKGCAEALMEENPEDDEDEMVALASQVSLMQTGFVHHKGPARSEELARLHESGIDDDDEALGLLDAVLGLA